MFLSPQLIVPVRRPPLVAAGLGLQTNLAACWEFENTSWLDTTGNGTTLTATGSPTSSNASTPKVGNYAAFDGGSYLSAANNSNINTGGGSFSVACWVYLPSAPGEDFIINKGADSFAQREWGLGTTFASGNKWAFQVYAATGASFSAVGATNISTNTWTLVTGTYDSVSKAAKIYLNDALDGTGTLSGTLASTTNALRIGANMAPAAIVNGARIDQCALWKGRVLTLGDVGLNYNSGIGLTYAAMA